MQPICDACQSSKLSWRIAIDSILFKNHHYSSGTRERVIGGERRHPDEKSTSALDRLLGYGWNETILVPASELVGMENNTAFEDHYLLHVRLTGWSGVRHFEPIMAVLQERLWEFEECNRSIGL
jgi:hypothetical protein